MIRVQTNLQPSERVVLFPSFGRFVEADQLWRIHVRGAVFDPTEIKLRKRMMLNLLRRFLNADPEQLNSELFRERIEAFAAATSRGRRITVRTGEHFFPLVQASHRNGRFGGTIHLSTQKVEQLTGEGWFERDRLKLQVIGPEANEALHDGLAHLIPTKGWSIVSDIDDTIKHTEVCSKRELLANTFLREFRCVDGMANVYRSLAAQGIPFHYVSSSPWQLYLPLADLVHVAGFPSGTFHLRSFRIRDHVLRRMTLHRGGKSVEIRRILESFPERKFILVGDSGERDPEIYTRLAKHFPNQVKAIFIRQIPQNPLNEARLNKIVGPFLPTTIRTFQESGELAGFFAEILAGALTSGATPHADSYPYEGIDQ